MFGFAEAPNDRQCVRKEKLGNNAAFPSLQTLQREGAAVRSLTIFLGEDGEVEWCGDENEADEEAFHRGEHFG